MNILSKRLIRDALLLIKESEKRSFTRHYIGGVKEWGEIVRIEDTRTDVGERIVVERRYYRNNKCCAMVSLRRVWNAHPDMAEQKIGLPELTAEERELMAVLAKKDAGQ